MAVLRFDKVSIAFANHPLLDAANLQIDAGERVGLIGRNGAGKSTLLKLANKSCQPDDGVIWHAESLKVSQLSQDMNEFDGTTVFDVLSNALEDTGKLLQAYHQLTSQELTVQDYKDLENIQQQIESVDGWDFHNRIDTILTRLGLKADQPVANLSGGWKRRVELARALVSEPDFLLLDEPTNHLDLITINWLESQLKTFKCTLLFITHDRRFLQTLATRIIELDRGQLYSWKGDYQSYLEDKAHRLEIEQTANAKFDKKLQQEEVWIRQGIKARRTRNEGRVRALEQLRKTRQQRRVQQGVANLSIESAKSSGNLVIAAEKLSFSYANKKIVDNFSTQLIRGDKVGLIGANGVGKTTLLQLLLGSMEAQSGKLYQGTRLEVAYFDQLREQLDPNKTVLDNVAQGRQVIELNGKQKHALSYLQDFLFSPKRALTLVKSLSGGERNRVLLALLFSKPTNFLILDEPTNDLDLETLDLLEELLTNFTGTLLLISHDRDFLDRVVTSTWVFKGQGVIEEFVGGFNDWLIQGGDIEQLQGQVEKEKTQQIPANNSHETKSKPRSQKLSYQEKRELGSLPKELDELEFEQKTLIQITESSDFFQQTYEQTSRIYKRLEKLEQLIDAKMERWAELDSKN